MRRENLLKGVWLGGGEKKKKKKVEFRCFFLGPTGKFSPNNRKKTVEKI